MTTRSVEKIGKTIEEAVQDGLEDLGLPLDKVEVKVLDEPSRGILGLVGQKPARVRLTEKVNLADEVCEFFRALIDHTGLEDISFRSSFNDGTLELEIYGDDVAALIGRRGATLDAVQYIVSIVAGNYWRELEASGNPQERIRIAVDAQGYRHRRVASLERLARSVSERVLRDGREIRLEPMNPMDRRIVHVTVQECQGVESFSEGEDPFRYVVVTCKKAE